MPEGTLSVILRQAGVEPGVFLQKKSLLLYQSLKGAHHVNYRK